MFDQLVTISEPTLRRLPLYYQLLLRKQFEKETFVSCPQIAKALDLTSIQVRKDLQSTGIVGKPRVGYCIEEVMAMLADLLGYSNTKEAVLIGVGNIGRALLGYDGFSEHGLNIIAAFDQDKNTIGKVYNGKRVYSIDKFIHIIRRLNVKIGIIATPAHVSQNICNKMVQSNIKAIWNFSPIYLEAPKNIIIENVNLTASLAVLSNKLESIID